MGKTIGKRTVLMVLGALLFTLPLHGQQISAAPSAPSPLSTPSITGPLQASAPVIFDGGPLGKLDLDGIVSGMGLWQGNHIPGDNPTQPALSNGQVFIQKTTGWWQFYVQAGAYNILALGTPFLSTEKAITDLYGPVPVAYLKLAPGKNTSILVGALPTLMGAEYTFDFENMNIERGLLWNQENAVNRGIQVNQTLGKFTASMSWNDGYYSNRYSWLSGSLTYTNGPHGGVRRYGEPRADSLSNSGHTCAKQRQYVCPNIYLYKRELDRSTILSIRQRADQSENRCGAGSVDPRRCGVSESHLQTRVLALGARGIHRKHGECR